MGERKLDPARRRLTVRMASTGSLFLPTLRRVFNTGVQTTGTGDAINLC